jgi:hypothetical protein
MADEAMLIARSALGPISSNIPLAGAELVSGMTISADTHTVLDFGADEMTRGRAHPMIDPSLRLQAIRNLGPRAGVLLLDLVLGHGAHADPADELAAAITDAKSTAAEEGRVLPVVVSLIGTSADPQDFSAAVRALVAADAEVFLSNAEASCRALAHLGCEAQMSTVIESSVPPERIPAALSSHSTGAQSLSGLLETAPSVVSVGLSLFAEELRAQAVPVTEVQWKPALGDPAALYQVMADPRRREANAQALERMLSAGAEVVGLRPARECLGLREDEFLHSGPPLEWDRASGPMRGALAGAVVFEGLAETLEAAEAGLADGRFTFAPCHSRDAVGPMAGVVSPSMWMFELVDPVHGNRAYCSLNEGLGKVLRYGANNEEVLTRLNWMRDVLGPVLAAAVAAHRAAGHEELRHADAPSPGTRGTTAIGRRPCSSSVTSCRSSSPSTSPLTTSPRSRASSGPTTTSRSTSSCRRASSPWRRRRGARLDSRRHHGPQRHGLRHSARRHR